MARVRGIDFVGQSQTLRIPSPHGIILLYLHLTLLTNTPEVCLVLSFMREIWFVDL